jgi:phosphoserine phosphatase
VSQPVRHILVASDFDKTLSFDDSGQVLSELLGAPDFAQKVDGLAAINIVQQGAELAYLLRHDPDFRRVRWEHLEQAGRRVRLKANVKELVRFFARGIEGFHFDFRVISAAPTEIVRSALRDLVPPEHIHGTDLAFDEAGEISSILRASAGYGKVVVLQALESQIRVRPDHIVYVGDGSSDLHAMLHVNQREGLTIAVSETQTVARTARRTVLSDNAMAVLIPILEEKVGWSSGRIRDALEEHGLLLKEWERARTDWLTFDQAPLAEPVEPSEVADPEGSLPSSVAAVADSDSGSLPGPALRPASNDWENVA